MSIVSQIDRRDIVSFYKNLHEERLLINRIIFYHSTGCLLVFFDVELGDRVNRPYKMVMFNDFEIIEEKMNETLQVYHKYTSKEINFMWRNFLYKLIGKSYMDSYFEHVYEKQRAAIERLNEVQRLVLRKRDKNTGNDEYKMTSLIEELNYLNDSIKEDIRFIGQK